MEEFAQVDLKDEHLDRCYQKLADELGKQPTSPINPGV
jgi:hypothetical protein